jgi:hypothetical protein
MTPYDSIRPVDRADAAPTDSILRDLCRVLTPASGEEPTIHIELSPAAWDKVRTYYRRPYRAEPREFRVGVQGGAVWLYSPGARERVWRRGQSPGWWTRVVRDRLGRLLARLALWVADREQATGNPKRREAMRAVQAQADILRETFSVVARPDLDTTGHAQPADTSSTYVKWDGRAK